MYSRFDRKDGNISYSHGIYQFIILSKPCFVFGDSFQRAKEMFVDGSTVSSVIGGEIFWISAEKHILS